MRKSLTILVPVYDEQECILPLFAEINKFLKQTEFDVHVLFIDDGSTDDSLQRIERICAQDFRYNFISLERNAGLSSALKAGIDACTTDLIGYMDADLQTTPSDFPLLLAFIDDYELVTGYRQNRKDAVVKKLTGRIANSFRKWLLDDDIIDTGCPLKIMKADVAKQMPFFKGMHRFIPNMTILLGGKVKQVPVQHFPRFAGRAKYHLLNRLIGPLTDAIVFRWMQRNAITYSVKKTNLKHD